MLAIHNPMAAYNPVATSDERRARERLFSKLEQVGITGRVANLGTARWMAIAHVAAPDELDAYLSARAAR